ncbi:M90 family metallopeptidase [Lishizhenia sp.]|uniref:M90 family metallopeptidase n=1 Tax=Lishizhenia sp. TaxID=2497594 RepID=UPI00299E834E|nr:M90 family metallopeptidase [Lishizhenia sp.]MDX1447265.1 M90 family metallopeptidase [Lishizhenia sp.]
MLKVVKWLKRNLLESILFGFALWAVLNWVQTPSLKAMGVFLVLCGFLVWLLVSNQKAKKRARIQRYVINTNDKFWLNKNIPFYENLNPAQKKIFEHRIGLFLAEIRVTEIGKEHAEKSTAFYVASAAVIAFWGLPYWNYGELSEVLVYPDNFNKDFEVAQTHRIQGQVYDGGLMDSTMSLSLSALELGFKNDSDKKNVGVHEFAHLLDKEDGSIDGLPFMMNKELREKWAQLAKSEMLKIQNGKSDINAYGGTNMAEFFAVILEYYKERPKLLQRKHPEMYSVLEGLFHYHEH